METTTDFLKRLEQLDIRLWLEGDTLRFNAPTGVLTPDLKRELSRRKPEVKAILDPQPATGDSREPLFQRVSRDGELPLSFAQQRLWLLHQIDPESPAYNVPMALSVQGPLDVDVLRRSFEVIMARHESLRTVFLSTQGRVQQVVRPPEDVQITVTDLAHLGEDEWESESARLLGEESHKPFDLSCGPLLRVFIMRRSNDKHLLLIALHHIVTDGWSTGILMRELAHAYREIGGGREPAFQDLQVQYADYAVWQRALLDGPTREEQSLYWRNQLGDVIPLDIMTDHPRPAIQTTDGAGEVLDFTDELYERLASISRAHGVTLFMTMLAVFHVLLHRYTGQDDIVIGTPVANRNRPQIEGLIGFFVNMLALRTRLSGDTTFRELLARVRDTVLDAYSREDVPFESLIEDLALERDLSRNPLFQATFAVQDHTTMTFDVGDVSFVAREQDVQTTRFDLEMHVFHKSNRNGVSIIYNTNLFEADTIKAMLRHYHGLLEAFVDDPDLSISHVPLLGPEERARITTAWNQTEREYPRYATVHEVFEGQAQREPDAIAVVQDGESISYGELNKRANQVAHRLVKAGVVPDTPVAVMMERSINIIVSLLGILKAGGAYVPIDSDYPRARITTMLKDSAARILLTQEDLVSATDTTELETLYIDADAAALRQEPDTNPGVPVRGDHLAYVMYTSGSTGMPKGACIEHRAINRLVCNTDYAQVADDDCVAQISNASFDAATFEIWGALLNGARLAILPREAILDPSDLERSLRACGITVMFITTALFNQVARERPGAFDGLRHVLFGGEAVDPSCVRSVLAHTPPERLLHVYGPTESTTFASWHHVTEVPNDADTVPIGKPIANTTLHVLDKHGNPVPVGVPGELHVGGEGLARGYWKRDDLTKQQFIHDPFSDDADARLYRTGDRVRRQADGSIVFLGRFDDQVKIRGFRIEPAEIEAVIADYEGVREGLVMARAENVGTGNERYLAAYVVPNDLDSFDVSALRTYLKERLPSYMVPSAYTVLDAFPLNENGKINRAALPEPGAFHDEGTAFEAPRSALEEMIVEIWQEVLRTQRVGVHDSFFDLGGNSLSLTRTKNRLEERLNISVPTVELFAHPTVSALADFLADAANTSTQEEIDDEQVSAAAHGKGRRVALRDKRKQEV